MKDASADTRSVVFEREVPHPPEKIWRALTQSHLIEEWLMKTDFEPVLDHRFNFRADWGAVSCQILEIEPNRTLAYSWGDDNLSSVVTWTLTPISSGTHLRMEQSGFRDDQPRYHYGATIGWPRFFANLERVLSGL
jgi:uncharacterized protein YndB with AHSA1/START domain